MRLKKNSDETVPIALIFQSILGTDIQRQKANMRLSRQGVPRALRQRCRHRGVELRSKLGSSAARCQCRQEHKYPIYPTTAANRADTTRHQNRPPSKNYPFGWEILHNINDLLTGASYAAGAIGGAQIGMIEYRQSLSINSRVLSFPKFAQFYRDLGATRRVLGRAGTAGAFLGTGMDFNSMRQDRLSQPRFIYRTSGTASSLVTSLVIGGASGAGWGSLVAFAFHGGEVGYDLVSKLVDELTQGIADTKRALQSGWHFSY